MRKQAADYWKLNTLPYTEPGLRLIRRSDVPTFDVFMTSVWAELVVRVAANKIPCYRRNRKPCWS